MTFGRRLRELRQARQISQRDLADWLDIDHTYLSKLENDAEAYSPSRKLICQLAIALQGDADELHARAGKVPQEIEAMFAGSHGARLFFRRAMDEQLTEEEWMRLLQAMDRITRERDEHHR